MVNAVAENSIVQLSEQNLDTLSKLVSTPTYDRSKLSKSIVHIGVGSFHRSHQALYIDSLIEKTKTKDWSIVGLGIMDRDAEMAQALIQQDCLYTLVERGSNSITARCVGSITDFIHGPTELTKALATLASTDTKIISLTVTEGGYFYNQATGELLKEHPAILHDRSMPEAPKTIYGYLVAAFLLRMKQGLPD
ncbi:MAG: hypothetical protein R3A13_01575 [Bdellovibrionota bacterium]